MIVAITHSVSLVRASNANNTCEGQILAVSLTAECQSYLQRQVETPFERKFLAIAPDVTKLSLANIESLKSAMRLHRDLAKSDGKATVMAHALETQMILLHGTRAEAALSIFNSDAIYSKEELVRRRIVPIANLNVNSPDGLIGEQDVVFLA